MLEDLKYIFNIRYLSPFERLVFLLLLLAVSVSGYILLYKLSIKNSIETPSYGGDFHEAIIGTARFINPALASSDTDKDISALVFSGLLKSDGKGGLEKDLADSFTISEDKTEYIFKLKDNVYFHDGVKLNANDVVFTIKYIQNPALKSPLLGNFEGVEVEAIDERTVKFKLQKPYSGFIENLTVGILPKHLWETIPAEAAAFSIYNEKAIGTGPYKIKTIEKNQINIPTKYVLEAYENYHLGRPKIDTVNFHVFSNNQNRLQALAANNFAAAYISAEDALDVLKNNKNLKLISFAYPRIFAIFINSSKNPHLAKKNLRLALSLATDKDAIVKEIFKGYADKINSPIPPYLKEKHIKDNSDKQNKQDKTIDELMEKLGYSKNEDGFWQKDGKELVLNISLANVAELKNIAYIIQDSWTKHGFRTKIKTYELGTLSQKIIRERDFDLLLFGEAPGRALELYAFWHSSQKDDPGLNISNYVEKDVDAILEKLREGTDKEEYGKLLAEFEKYMIQDVPAIFLYSPKFLYLVPKDLKGIDKTTEFISNPSERFANVQNWYFKTERLWTFLSD